MWVTPVVAAPHSSCALFPDLKEALAHLYHPALMTTQALSSISKFIELVDDGALRFCGIEGVPWLERRGVR